MWLQVCLFLIHRTELVRHIDCAAIYGNEEEVGKAFAYAFSKGIKREDIFITSKLWITEKKAQDVRPAFMKTLHDLGLKYLDLYISNHA